MERRFAKRAETEPWERLGLGRFFQTAPFAAIVAEAAGGAIVCWNEAARRLFEHPSAETPESSIDVLIPGVFLDQHRERDEPNPIRNNGTGFVSGMLEANPVDLFAVQAGGRMQAVEVERCLLEAEPYPTGTLVLVIARESTRRHQVASEAERRLAGIVEASDDAIISVSTRGVITSWNPAATRIYGYQAHEAIGKDVSFLIPPANLEEFSRLVAHLKRGERVIHQEVENLTKDQRHIIVAVTVSPLRDDAGRLTGMATVARDITETRQRAIALARAEARLRAIWETTSEAICMVGEDGVILMANPAQANLLGVPVTDIVGAPFTEFVLPEQQTALLEMFRARQKHPHGSTRLEMTTQRRDGTPLQLQVVIDDVVVDGRVVATIALTRNITERVHAEQALRTSEQRFRLLVEQLPAAVYLLANDAIQTPLYMSPQVEALLDRSVASILAREESWLARVHPNDAARITARSDRNVDDGDEFNEQYRFRRSDGSYVWVWDICLPIRDETGAIVAWQGVMFDVSDQHELRLDLERARDAAEESNRLKSVFLSTMSHELRTPMNAIIGYAHVLLDGMAGMLTPDQHDAVQEIAIGADRLLGVINDVLDLSRIESGAIDLVREPVDIRRLLGSVQSEIAPLATRKGLEFAVETSSPLPWISCDGFRVRQIVVNLASNAVKFTERGAVRICASVADDRLLIAVSDTGIGIEATVLPVIFDEFRQADARTTRRYGGSGLGLTIARRLAELHGGRLSVESVPAVGSTFTLALPFEP